MRRRGKVSPDPETTDEDEDGSDDDEPPRRRQPPKRRSWGTFALVALALAVAAYAATAATQPSPKKCDKYETIPGDVCDEPGHMCESINPKSDCMWHLECKSNWMPGFRGQWTWAPDPLPFCNEDGSKPPPPPTFDVTSQAQADQRCPKGWGFAPRDRVDVYVPCAKRGPTDKNGVAACIGGYGTVPFDDVYETEKLGGHELTPAELFAQGMTVRIQCKYR